MFEWYVIFFMKDLCCTWNSDRFFFQCLVNNNASSRHKRHVSVSLGLFFDITLKIKRLEHCHNWIRESQLNILRTINHSKPLLSYQRVDGRYHIMIYGPLSFSVLNNILKPLKVCNNCILFYGGKDHFSCR